MTNIVKLDQNGNVIIALIYQIFFSAIAIVVALISMKIPIQESRWNYYIICLILWIVSLITQYHYYPLHHWGQLIIYDVCNRLQQSENILLKYMKNAKNGEKQQEYWLEFLWRLGKGAVNQNKISSSDIKIKVINNNDNNNSNHNYKNNW